MENLPVLGHILDMRRVFKTKVSALAQLCSCEAYVLLAKEVT
jgi:hypothetical protein